MMGAANDVPAHCAQPVVLDAPPGNVLALYTPTTPAPSRPISPPKHVIPLPSGRTSA